MVHSQPRECIMVEGSRFCKSEPATPEGIATGLIGIPAAIIMWAIMGFVVAKIVSKYSDTDIVDNPLCMFAGILVPPMLLGLIILLFS